MAIGANADWYLERWRTMDARRSQVAWNWAACLANVAWFAYRKMWAPVAVLALVLGALVVLGLLSIPLLIAGGGLFLLAILATGALGTSFYRQHVSRLVAATQGMEREAALAQLRARGGTSAAAGIALAVLALAAGAGAGYLAWSRARPAPPPPAPVETRGTPADGGYNQGGPVPPVQPETPGGMSEDELLRNQLEEARNMLLEQGVSIEDVLDSGAEVLGQ